MKKKNVTSDKNELNELSKKVKALSTKGFTKDLINEVNRSKIEQKDFLQEYFIITQYLYQLKNYIKYLSSTTRIDLWKSN